MPDSFDLFLSYARVDSAPADPLVRALEQAGVTVWRDTEQIDTFSAIRQAIDEGLARSKVLLAFYSRAYTERRACDWELASAFIAGGPERILVLNPENGADHIQPQSLREHQFANRDDLEALDALAAKIKARVAGVDGSFGQLPSPPADQKWFGLSPKGAAQTFVGRRSELWQVHGALAAGDSVMVAPTTTGLRPGDGSTVVRGLGGMGKTLLAEEYARRFAAAWPGGVFWMKAGGGEADGNVSESRLLDQYLALARALTLTFDPADPASLKNAIEAAMAARPGPYLWVVDDMPHGLSTEQARAWFAPTVSLGGTLITTRTRTLDDVANPVELAELGENEAYILLTLERAPKNDAEAKAAHAIVEELGRHALAVDLARHLVKLQGFGKVLTDLHNPSKEALSLAARLTVELPTGHEKSIAQTFLRSIQLLDANALDALRVAAYLAPHTPIPCELLVAIRELADAQTEEQAVEDAVLALDQTAAHSLCEISDTGYVVHALVCRTIALRYADDRSQALRQASVEALGRLFQQAPDARNHPRLVPLLPHAHAASEALETAEQAVLTNGIARYYLAAGQFPAAKEHYARGLEALRSILGPDHPNTLNSMNNLAETLSAQGDLARARDLQQQTLEARRRILGPDHPNTLNSMGNLAETLRAIGDLRGATDLQRQALEARRRILGPDHPNTLASMNNLALCLQALGDLPASRDLQQRTLEARRRVLGPNHPDTLTSMGNLAVTLHAQGDLHGAKDLQQQTLGARQRTLGPDHPNTLKSMNNLAEILRAHGDLSGAKAMHEQELDACRRILGPDHPETLISMNNLAVTLHAQGDLAGAVDLLKQTLEARRRVLGPHHQDTLRSAFMLAQHVALSGELAEAMDLAAWAAVGLEAKLGPNHPHSQMALEVLAKLATQRNNAPAPD